MRWLSITAVSALASLTLAVTLPAQAQANKKPAVGAAPAVVDHAGRLETVCAACHGANGRSDMARVPVLAGNSLLYMITQRFLFREGRRENEAMAVMAKPMTDADLRGFSDYSGTLAAVLAPALARRPTRLACTRRRRSPSNTSARIITSPIWPAVNRCRASVVRRRTTFARRCMSSRPASAPATHAR